MRAALVLVLLVTSWTVYGQEKKDVTLPDVWARFSFWPSSPDGFNWMNDDQYYSVLENNKIVKYDIKTQKPDGDILDIGTLTDPTSNGELKVQSYRFSADEQKVLLITESTPIYRRSTKDVCYVYDMQAKKLYEVHNGRKVSFATFSPDGSKLAYMHENDLYFMDFGQQSTQRITNDGKWGAIINGGTDWVYEEEYAFTKAFFWSPDNKKIAYYRFDESHVKEFQLEYFGELYPEQYRFKYPKAGEKNAVVQIKLYDLETKKITNADIGKEKDQYIPRVKWTKSAANLAVMRMNRLQNVVDILLVDGATGKSKVILSEKSDTYITEPTDATWTFLENGTEFVWQSDRDGFNHLYLYDLSGKLVRQITKGDWEVRELCGIDEANGVAYYLSSEPSELESHLYSIKMDGKKAKKLTKEPGWHDVAFSSKFNYYMDSYSSVEVPGVSALYSAKGKKVLDLEDNAALVDRIGGYDLSPLKFFKFKTSENVYLNGWMIKPKQMENGKKYPVLMFCYGGPGNQQVKNSYLGMNYFWYQALAAQGYGIVCVDNRGTGGRGRDFKKCTYGKLGELETKDQIEAAKYLAQQDWVDGNRIGIWGWSFGGYLSSLCITKGADIFKLAVAVAPVTNWRFYDTIYTERYLKTPQQNASGYDDNSPINFVDQLKGKYLLIHGMADDNVHYQNAVEMSTALIKAGKDFDMMYYPNNNHGIYGSVEGDETGPFTRYHLFRKIENYLIQNL